MNINNTRNIIESIPSNVQLIAVTKNQTIEDVTALHNLGVTDFGENRLQELVKKKALFPEINWHFIGRIQSNKLKDVVKHAVLIHSVSELRYLEKINIEAGKINKVQDILLQVNIAGEETKKGISNDEFNYILENQDSFTNVRICGLMVMGDHVDDQTTIANTFKQAKDLFDTIHSKHAGFKILSMGMSSDYQLAIDYGSNMVRIGTLLFKD